MSPKPERTDVRGYWESRCFVWRRIAKVFATLATMVCCAAAENEKPATYVEILRQLTDLDRLATLQTGCKGGLFSSWDRRSQTQWGANGDVGQYLRVEPNGGAVMMDFADPGVVYRIWSANPMGKLRIYLTPHRLSYGFRRCSCRTPGRRFRPTRYRPTAKSV